MKLAEEIIKEAKKQPIQKLISFSILNIDKPSGPTSFSIDEYIRKIFETKKTSHFGTLDPAVGGVLPIAIKRACRLMRYFIKENKTYVGVMHLHKNVKQEILEGEIKKFVGKIKQVPPRKSSVKRQERTREIYEFEILEREGKDVLFEVSCEAGTYIRKLIHDLGEKIGGAHMTELRRTKAGIFSEKDREFVNLYQFDEAIDEWKNGNDKRLREILIPGEVVLKIMPYILVREDKDIIKKLYNGFMLRKEWVNGKIGDLKNNILAAVTTTKLIGIYQVVGEKNILAKPQFVYKPE